MPRRLGPLTPRRVEDWEDVLRNSEENSPRSKSRSYPNLAVCVVLTVTVFGLFLAFGYPDFKHPSDKRSGRVRRVQSLALSDDNSDAFALADEEESSGDYFTSGDGLRRRSENIAGNFSSRSKCRAHICNSLPILQDVYGKILHRTLHVGPDTCGVVAELRKGDDVEVWGIQPFDMKRPIHSLCKRFIHKGIVRISDPHQPLPYRKKSFSFVLVTYTLDQMTTKQLNTTLLDIAGLSSHSMVLVVGKDGDRFTRAGIFKSRKLKPRNRIWWQRRFALLGLKENMELTKRFEILQSEKSFKSTSNIFHLHAPDLE